MTNKNDRLVVAYYPNVRAAEQAVEAIKQWDHASSDVKFGAIAIMTLDEKGELHADEIGQRSTKSGALWGTAVGAAVGLLAGGIGIIPGAIAGAAGGGGLGTLNHKSVGMTDADKAALEDNLKHGGAAVAVMADDFEVPALEVKMADLGGTASNYVVEETVAIFITETADAQRSASEAIDDVIDAAADEAEDMVEEVSRSVEVDLPDLDEAGVRAVSKIAAVTGISAFEAEKLYNAGVAKASNLLEMAATPQGRTALAEFSGVEEDEILLQAKKLDLMRVKGVGVKYATLLLVSGVDTVPELATRNPANLATKMAETNEMSNVVEDVPSETMVSDWVGQAKDLPRMLYY
ncbi:MAG: DUF4332 domain-containing protein [Candidatus Promineifilaceae bacterium]